METATEKRQDKEANYFARCILMPKPLIEEELEKYTSDKPTSREQMIKEMSKLFQVTQVQMTVRLIDLKILI